MQKNRDLALLAEMPLHYAKTPVMELQTPATRRAGVRLLIKREDLNHPFVSGNKWWKLKYNLEAAQQQSCQTLLTFGGAYSNHIYATAAAAHELGLKSIGIIRGEETIPLNPTLAFAKDQGMELQYLSRTAYRSKHESEFINQLKDRYGDFYLIPEGGTNQQAIKGVVEWAQQLQKEVEFKYVCVAVGTGGTLAGLAEGLDKSKEIIGFPVLKNALFLEAEIRKYTNKQNWKLNYDYHFGGYAKTSPELMTFLQAFENEHGILLDPVYTARLMYGVFDWIERQGFPPSTTILVLHTGGLQGRAGFHIT